MPYVDLNCDMGEGMGQDEKLMPFITSANIACGYHAGDDNTMAKTIELCLQHQVAIGAHPSFPDKANFGRSEMDCTEAEVYLWVQQQVKHLQAMAHKYDAPMRHVKPHGALYNRAARDQAVAKAIVNAVKDIDEQLILVGLSGSYLISEADAAGLASASEVFADRTYQDDGSLTPRTQPNALIDNESASLHQVLQMVKSGKVTALSGKEVLLKAQTICLHGDGQHAAIFAEAIHKALTNEGITLTPLYSFVQ